MLLLPVMMIYKHATYTIKYVIRTHDLLTFRLSDKNFCICI